MGDLYNAHCTSLNLFSMALWNASCASLISFEVWIACFSSHRKPPFVECSFASLIFVRAWAYVMYKELNSLASLNLFREMTGIGHSHG